MLKALALQGPDRFAAIFLVGGIPAQEESYQAHHLMHLGIRVAGWDQDLVRRFAVIAGMYEILKPQAPLPQLKVHETAFDGTYTDPYRDPEFPAWLADQRRRREWPQFAEWFGNIRLAAFPTPREIVDLFQAHEHSFTGGRYENKRFRYRLFEPKRRATNNPYPLIIWLHGHGDHELKFDAGQLKYIELIFKDPSALDEYPFFLLAPQCPEDRGWFDSGVSAGELGLAAKSDEPIEVLMEIFDSLCSRYPIDRDRIALVGISTGAGACWELAMRYPDRFAGIAPLASNGGDLRRIERLKRIRVWAFHSLFDNHPPDGDRLTVTALRHHGGDVRYTEIPLATHACWYDAFEEHGLLEWLLECKR